MRESRNIKKAVKHEEYLRDNGEDICLDGRGEKQRQKAEKILGKAQMSS